MRDSSLYVGDEKVCGILTEGLSDLETGIFSNYIVGIGVRVRRLQALGNTAPQKNKVIADIIRALI
jgi:BirA family biotin operon repressor/biotin-[acetyl-CoA-carboxylase] ligase